MSPFFASTGEMTGFFFAHCGKGVKNGLRRLIQAILRFLVQIQRSGGTDRNTKPAADAAAGVKIDFFLFNSKSIHGAAFDAQTALRAERFVKTAHVVAFHGQGGRRKKLERNQHAATAGTAAAHRFDLPGIQDMDHQPFGLTLFEDRQGLVGVDVARHAVFHVVVGKGVKLKTGFRRMNAGLSVQSDGLSAETFGHGRC